MKKEFRNDINTLRSIAVLLVVLFHFKIKGFESGFIGVDIFFVISGFLMTGIILEALEEKKFNLIEFYLARFRRLLPAIFFLLTALLLFGFFFLEPLSYKSLGNQTVASASFTSNFLYWISSGYFDPSSEEMLLLHTWSLSLEMQFYMLYPVAALAIWKAFPGRIAFTISLLLIFITSLLLSIFLSDGQSNFSFYLLPTRAWELAAGGLCYLVSQKIKDKCSNLFLIIGLLLVAISFIFLNDKYSWPSAWASLPVLGTCFMLVANKNNLSIYKIKIIETLGKSSYSIYLWHWPIASLIYISGNSENYIALIFGVTASLIIGYFSYLKIEQKTAYFLKKQNKQKQLLIITIPILTIIIVALGVRSGIINQSSFKKEIIGNNMPLLNNGYCFYSFNDDKSLRIGKEATECNLQNSSDGKSEKIKAIIFGDSFAGHYDPFWKEIGRNKNLDITSISTNWCYPSFSKNFTGPKSSRSYEQCLLNRKFLKKSKDKIDLLIISGHYHSINKNGYLEEIFEVADYFSENGVKVIFMPTPKIYDRNPLNEINLKIKFKEINDIKIDSKKDIQAKILNSAIEDYSKTNENFFFIKREELFPKNQAASEDLAPDGTPYTLDGRHISINGSLNAALNFVESEGHNNLIDFLNKR